MVQNCLIAIVVFVVAFPTECRRRCKYGVRRSRKHHLAQAPLSRTVVGRPFAAASKGHVIIQCGPYGEWPD